MIVASRSLSLPEGVTTSSEEPGWRDIACGVDGDVFVWSARRLVVVPLDEGGGEPRAVDCDEDIVTVFQVEDGWMLVCETSLRLVGGEGEVVGADAEDLGDADEEFGLGAWIPRS